MKMNFQCEELTISDLELGCTVTFSDSRSADDQFISMEEIMNSSEKYLLIQRTYSEDGDGEDYYIESSETDSELNPKDKMIVRLSREIFEIKWSGDQLKIGLNLSDKELSDLREIFETRFKERTTIIEN